MMSDDQSLTRRVAYQGVPGAYSHGALLQFIDSGTHPELDIRSNSTIFTNIEPLACESFEDAFRAVIDGLADLALLPIHNSLGGAVHANYDLLLRYKLHVIGETHFRVHHSLLALPGTEIKQLKLVMSHPQALAQCDEYIRKLGISRQAQGDTAGSAKMIAEQKLKNTAAIASKHAAAFYGLDVLDENIEDEEINFTRFLLLSREEKTYPKGISGKNFITSLVFALQNNLPGALFKALSVFALRDIDLTKIESRPAKGLDGLLQESKTEHSLSPTIDRPSSTPQVFHYLFYADVVGHVEEVQLVNALRHLGEIAPVIRVLGSYPRDDSFLNFGPTERVRKNPSFFQRGKITIRPSRSLKIAIFGFGNFGQFLAKEFIRNGHQVWAWNHTEERTAADRLGACYHESMNAFKSYGEGHFDVVLFAISILAFESVAKSFPFTWSCFKTSLIVDVLSVKTHPKTVIGKCVPETADILLTHPMFGPESGKNSWVNLPMVYERVRIRDLQRCNDFLAVFNDNGCDMMEMQAETHDAYAAGSQFITHLTGRVLSRLGPASTPINTKGFEVLLKLVENTCKDSWDLFSGIFKYNPRSLEQLNAFEEAFFDVKSRLLADLISTEKNNEEKESQVRFCPRVMSVKASATAQVMDVAENLKREGKQIINLNVGEPDFPVPQKVKDAIVDALNKNLTKYTSIAGIHDLRQAICSKLEKENGLTYSPDQVVVSAGAKQSLLQTVMALVCPGDQVVIPSPYWTSYSDMATLCGGQTVEIPATVNNNFKLTAESLRESLSKLNRPKLLMLNYPSNPTGVVYAKEELLSIAKVLESFPNVFIISDEIYEYILYEGEHISFASLPGMFHRTITVNGFSKAYCMTGLRVGYMAGPKPIASQVSKIQSHVTSSICSTSQYAALAALSLDRAEIQGMVTKFKERRNFVVSELKKISGMRFPIPQGAFYVFVDISEILSKNKAGLKTDTDFCVGLLTKKNIAVVPGIGFGMPGCFRISYSTSMPNLENAMEGIRTFVQEIMQS